MININDYKDLKKTKIILNELIIVKDKLTNVIDQLSPHKKFIPIMESLSVLHNSRTLIEININKYRRLINKND